MKYCIVLALALGALVFVHLHSRVATFGLTDRTSSDDVFLQDLPLPEFDPKLDLPARFRLVFSSSISSNGPATTSPQQQQHGPDDNGAADRTAAGPEYDADSGYETTKPRFGHRSHSRLVVLPDLHGDGPQALRALQLAGLVSAGNTSEGAAAAEAGTEEAAAAAAAAAAAGEGPAGGVAGGGLDGAAAWRPWAWQWAGGDAVLVQLGDVVDRGPDSLALLVLLERLRVQARGAGGDVVTLLGNHELMNIFHDFRYVSPAELLALAAAGGLPPEWAATTEWVATSGAAAAFAADGRRLAGGAGGGEDRVDVDLDGEGGGSSIERASVAATAVARGASEIGGEGQEYDTRKRVREDEAAEVQEEESSLAAEAAAARRRSAAADRELLYANNITANRQPPLLHASAAARPATTPEPTDVGSDSADGASWSRGSWDLRAAAGGATARHHRQLLLQGHQHHQQPQLLAGLDIWRDALAPTAPLGLLIRQRPLAAIIDAGGCRILAVHAGAFPWMLRGVEKLLQAGPGPPGLGSDVGARPGDDGGGGSVAAAAAEGSSSGSLRPEQYVAAWNAVVAAAVGGCEGRACGRRRSGGDAATGHDQYEVARAALADMLLGGEGAVWSRRYDRGPPHEVCGEVAVLVRRLSVDRVVVGHSVRRGGRVSSRCGGQLLLADVGLSRDIAGEMAVLQCSEGRLDAVYGSGRVDRLS